MPLLDETRLTLQDVNQNQAAFSNIQGYTLVSHGREKVLLALLRAKVRSGPKVAAFRTQLARYGSQATPALELYRNYHAYLKAKEAAAAEDPAAAEEAQAIKRAAFARPVRAIGITSAGYDLLAPQFKPPEIAFNKGFAQNFPDLSAESPHERHDAILAIAGSEAQLEAEKAAIRSAFGPLADIDWEPGFLKAEAGVFREFFGFRDGISQPIFFEIDLPKAMAATPRWDPSASLAFVLLPEPSAPNGDEYGSHMAMLKIRQDAESFHHVSQQMGTACGVTSPTAASWMIGRTADGQPLVDYGTDDNDFNFEGDPEFSRCPSAAHIRKVNPRSRIGNPNRVLRRSAFYKRGDDCGLLFQCFQSKLKTGFEQILRGWALNGNHPRPGSGPDALLGKREIPPKPEGVTISTGTREFPADRVAHVKYGEYFYFPSIRLFSRLAG